MIYVTGDCHGDYSRFLNTGFCHNTGLTKDDYVIIAGDFGYWDESEKQRNRLQFLDSLPFTTLFVDGNHENFDLLYSLPVSTWKGGKVHKITDSVIHLMRGQVFTIDGATFFTFGGASSHDIQGGVIELDDPNYRMRVATLYAMGWSFRVNHLSWWKEELPSQQEMDEGIANLDKCGWNVDFVITHCHNSLYQGMLVYENSVDRLNQYFDDISQRLNYKRWYFGHYHTNKAVTYKDICLYGNIEQIM